MQSKRDELVPVEEVVSGLDGPVAAIRDASPQALHHYTQADQVNQLVPFHRRPSIEGMYLSQVASRRRGFQFRGVAFRGVRLS